MSEEETKNFIEAMCELSNKIYKSTVSKASWIVTSEMSSPFTDEELVSLVAKIKSNRNE